ncbi:radical SAM protein [Candidatus Dependentiae bacterium]|nr:radical SAM protein [Candidatus Dependentiae bacterium]
MNNIFLMLTNECNNNCFYCLNNLNKINLHSRTQELSLSQYIELISKMKKAAINNIILTGGEPLLNNNINAIVSEAYKNGISTLLLTNAELITEESMTNLKNSGLNAVTVSLSKLIDSDSEDFNNLLNFYYDKTETVKKIFGTVTSTFLLSSKNHTRIYDVYKKVSKSENKHFIIQPLHIDENLPAVFKKYSLSEIDKKFWKNIKEQLSDWMIENNTYSYVQLIQDYYEKNDIKGISCFMGSAAAVIDVFGNVFPCFHRKDLYAGNVITGNFNDILINALYKSNNLIDAGCISSKCLSLFISYV